MGHLPGRGTRFHSPFVDPGLLRAAVVLGALWTVSGKEGGLLGPIQDLRHLELAANI